MVLTNFGARWCVCVCVCVQASSASSSRREFPTRVRAVCAAHTHRHTHTHLRIRARTHDHMHTDTPTRPHAQTHIHTHAQARAHHRAPKLISTIVCSYNATNNTHSPMLISKIGIHTHTHICNNPTSLDVQLVHWDPETTTDADAVIDMTEKIMLSLRPWSALWLPLALPVTSKLSIV